MTKSNKLLLTGAAIAGLLAGTGPNIQASTLLSGAKTLAAFQAGSGSTDSKQKADSGKKSTKGKGKKDVHTCKGLNSCKGKGGCGATKGKNECKGKGECRTDGKPMEK